jgi:UTP pyrophosphatase
VPPGCLEGEQPRSAKHGEPPVAPMKYLQAYPQTLQNQVAELLHTGQLGARLQRRYRRAHEVRTDRALYDYVMALKNSHLRGAEPLSKIAYDSKLQVIAHALGTHTTVSRVQGSKLKSKREIRIASLFKDTPVEFLRMITVHELAHLKEKAHGARLPPDRVRSAPVPDAPRPARAAGLGCRGNWRRGMSFYQTLHASRGGVGRKPID